MLRVLHAPVNVGNQPWVLSRQERTLGLSSDLIVNYGTWLQYPADKYLSANTGVMTYRDFAVRAWNGYSAAIQYDVLHYYFGKSFLGEYAGSMFMRQFSDLRLARRLGKTIIMTLQGCDVRQSDRNSARNSVTMCHLGKCQYAANCRSTLDPLRRKFINEVLPLCDRVFVLNPDLVNDVPKADFLPYASVDIDSFQPSWPTTHGPIRILHAPSDESVKGTRFVVEAIEKLKHRWDIELILVKGLPYAEALKRYTSADLVIDQLLAGWYGGFAVEMMAMGKPVACYIRQSDLDHVPASMRTDLPLLPLNIDSLESDIERLLLQRQQWPEWGRNSREFVFRWHNPNRIAKAIIQVYRDPSSAFELKHEPQEAAKCAA
jgi:glycosyltransferase involved in cell wall biosynthesis